MFVKQNFQNALSDRPHVGWPGLPLAPKRMNDPVECFLIDDDEDDQEIFAITLESISRSIVCNIANNGVEALRILTPRTTRPPDFIFIDVNMPKMNGLECLKKLKSLAHLSGTKVFMYSTTSEKKTVEASKEMGAIGFIIKPASPAVLKVTLSEILDIRAGADL